MKASTFFLGLLAGSATAAITVLYSTPKTGSELRSSVKHASADMKFKVRDVKEKLSNLKESITDLSKEAKEVIPDTVEGLKGSIGKWQEATASNQTRLHREILDIQTSLEELERTISSQMK